MTYIKQQQIWRDVRDVIHLSAARQITLRYIHNKQKEEQEGEEDEEQAEEQE
ncbi:hypothetical protein DPMN_188107 [Dreissena polymorpha]|uniref:Uncharacterized protein n=1 Tax=Dreissena polymorpha TaxID=45954 RepID=A0A9D4DSA7_DREPO|nr:hypothetical protein DPMN_188107 [Dreissena polymorpha]